MFERAKDRLKVYKDWNIYGEYKNIVTKCMEVIPKKNDKSMVYLEKELSQSLTSYNHFISLGKNVIKTVGVLMAFFLFIMFSFFAVTIENFINDFIVLFTGYLSTMTLFLTT